MGLTGGPEVLSEVLSVKVLSVSQRSVGGAGGGVLCTDPPRVVLEINLYLTSFST